jgi:hypothetical protein
MKTERRHELQTNELADWLGTWMQKLAPYSRAITAGVIAVAALVAFSIYLQSQSVERQRAGWNNFFQAINSNESGELEAVANQFSGAPVSVWSRLLLADTELGRGIEMMFSDRAAGKERLRNARQSYLTASTEASDPMLRERAIFGLARANEALGEREDLDQALANYQRLVDEWPEGVFAEEARQRIEELNKESTREFLDWFAQQSPSPGRGFLPGTPGVGPGFDSGSLPTGPGAGAGDEFNSPFSLDPSAPGGDDGAEEATFDSFDPLDTTTDPPDVPADDGPR